MDQKIEQIITLLKDLKTTLFELSPEIIVELKKFDYKIPTDYSAIHQIFNSAAKKGHLELMKLLFASVAKYIRIDDDYEPPFINACKFGNIEVAKWLDSLKIIKIYDYTCAFNWACAMGHFEVAKWLHSLGNIDIHHNNDNPFCRACEEGHIEIAKWLYSLAEATPKINILIKDNVAFRTACQNGHLEVAKWLYSLDPKVYEEPYHVFHIACNHGHIEVAKWLYSLVSTKINMHDDDEYAFYNACINGHFEIIKWLYSIAPDIKLKPEQVKLIKKTFDEISIIVDKVTSK